jgi:hypothetical protein
MAGMKFIDEARNVLEEAALMTTETVRAFYGIVEGADVDTPPWLFHPGHTLTPGTRPRRPT